MKTKELNIRKQTLLANNKGLQDALNYLFETNNDHLAAKYLNWIEANNEEIEKIDRCLAKINHSL